MSAALTPYALAQKRDAQRRRWIAAIATPVIGATLVAVSIPVVGVFLADLPEFIALAVTPMLFVLGMTIAGAAARAHVAAIIIVSASATLALGIVQNVVFVEANLGSGVDMGLPIVLPAAGALAVCVGSLIGLIFAKIVLGQVRAAPDFDRDRSAPCPCGYPRAGLTSDVCPECGRAIPGHPAERPEGATRT